MPTGEIFTETIAKLTKRIEELKTQMGELRTQVGELDVKSTTAYNTSVSLADAIAQQKKALEAQQQEINNLKETRSVTTTTPPTADSTGLPGFVVLDTKPETEYKNYVYIYPRN